MPENRFKDVKKYLSKLAPYVKFFREHGSKIIDGLTKEEKELIVRLGNIQDKAYYNKHVDKMTLDTSHTDDLLELYFFSYGRKTALSGDRMTKLSNMHDAWAIARLIEFDFENKKVKDYIANPPKPFDLTTTDDVLPVISALKSYIVPIKYTVQDVKINSVVRLDQLSMFVEYDLLTKEIAQIDEVPLESIETIARIYGIQKINELCKKIYEIYLDQKGGGSKKSAKNRQWTRTTPKAVITQGRGKAAKTVEKTI